MKKSVYLFLAFLVQVCFLQESLLAQGAKDGIVKDGDWYFTNKVYTRGEFGYGQVEFSGKKEGVVFINASGQPGGEVQVPGHILGIGHVAGGIIAFYTQEWSERFYKRIRTIGAVLIDPVQKRILLDKTVYSNAGNEETMPEIGNDPDGNFEYLLIRTARFKDEIDITLSMRFIFLSADLEVSARTFPSVAVGNTYIGSCPGLHQDIFITSQSNDRIITEKFDQAGKLTDSLSVAAGFRKGKHFDALLGMDNTGGHSVQLAVKYIEPGKDYIAGLFRFDFETGKTFAAVGIALAKDYTLHLKELQSDIRTSRLKFLEDLKPVQLFTEDDRVIVVSNIEYTSSLGIRDVPPRYTSGAGIITIYDRSLKLIREFVLDKKLECTVNLNGGLGCRFINGKLYILSPELPGNGSGLSDYCYILDPVTLGFEKKKLDRRNASGGMVMNPASAFWFSDHLVMSHVMGEHFLGTRWTTTLQKLAYRDIK